MSWQYPDLVWVADLSDGSVFAPSDKCPDSTEAWYLLKRHCALHQVKIIHLKLKFRTHKIPLPFDDKDGYYFTKAASAFMGQEANHTSEQFGFGYLEDDMVHMVFYQVPELIRIRDDVRPISKCVPEKLIIYDNTTNIKAAV